MSCHPGEGRLDLSRTRHPDGESRVRRVSKRVCLEHVPEAVPDDYVLVHVGSRFAIDEAEARRVFAFLESMDQLDELKSPP